MVNKGGFSLIELIIIMGIITILLAIAGISGRIWLNKNQVESTMKEISTDLMNAQVSAMDKNRMYFAVFGPSTAAVTQFSIYEDTHDDLGPNPDGDGSLQIAADTQVVQKNLKLSMTAESLETHFNARGLVSAGTQTIRVTDAFGSPYNCIVISVSRIRIGAWNGANCIVQ